MKKMLLIIALAVVASFAWGQTTRQPLMKTQEVPQQPQRTTTTATTTTEGTGTITEYTPGSVIVLRGTSGPVRYRFGKTVTYVTRSGRVLDENTVRTRIKVGVPVRVHYVGTGENTNLARTEAHAALCIIDGLMVGSLLRPSEPWLTFRVRPS